MKRDSLLHRVKKVRISDSVVDQIIGLIEAGQLNVGDQLPGERELVSQLQVGRASVREALRILEAQGVVEVRPGRGTFVTSDVETLSGSDSVKAWFDDHVDEIRSIIELREALERKAAYLAATRAAESLLRELTDTLDEADRCLSQEHLDKLVLLDQRFHSLLGRASGNDLLAELVDGVADVLSSPRRSILRLEGRAEASAREHRAILNAIVAGDAEAAEEAVISHINSVRKEFALLQKREENLLTNQQLL